ncbi:hypothetical protein AB3331_00490 [Streptococcus sp. H49]|uniref:hypothetical protein n=1 Tax=Streptococcus huangxiaojuni TaxID=3237239 RepID=UPI0034A47452
MKTPAFTVLLLLSASLLLTACQEKAAPPEGSFSQAVTEETAASSQSSSSPSTSSESTEAEAGLSDEELYAETLQKVAADQSDTVADHYAFYDIDHNGTNELITGYSSGGTVSLAAIYYLQNGVPAYLAQSYVPSAGGHRENAVIYDDGTVAYAQWHSLNGEGTAYLYQLRADNSGYDVLIEQEFQISEGNPVPTFDSGRTALNIKQFDWKDF